MRRAWLVLFGLLLVPLGLASAQERVINGTVMDSATGEPVGNADVAIRGTLIRVTARDNGRFVLARVPDAGVTLVIRALGYHRQEVLVGPGQNQVTVTLGRDIFRLEEVVITGQATGVEKQNLPNAVATVSADELSRAPAQTLEGALQGKVPGALIQANSGAPGGGMQLSLRGVSTINGSVDPLYVVDGVVISNTAIANGANAVTAAAAGGNASNQDNPVNRIADLNPNDIERIEVLKGGSAAAIYGARATNGVVIITTKRGHVGAPQFNISQRFGISGISHKLGFHNFRDSAEVAGVFGAAVAAQYFQPGVTFDNEEFLYGRKPLSTETDASVSGGSDATRYYVSALVKNDEGIAINTDYGKQAVRANLDQILSNRVSFAVNTNVIHSRSNRGLSNNDNSGTSPYLVFPFTPNFVDLRAKNGVFPDNPFERSNPLQTFDLLKNEEDVWRIIGTMTARVALLQSERQSLNLLFVGGADYFTQRNDFLSPPELEFEPNDGQPGTVVLTKSTNQNLNFAANATHTMTAASGSYQATTSIGMQYQDRDLNITGILGRTLLTGQTSPSQAASQDPSESIEKVRNLGFFGQEELLLMDRRLLLTVGLRADRSSANGDPSHYFFYPKAAVSYRLIHPVGLFDEIKLRAAYGQTGNEPLFGQKFSPDTSLLINGRFGVLVGNRLGDADIEPEVQKEFETGFDANLAGGRATISFSVYQKSISNLLLDQTLAPSTGYGSRIFNSGGTLRNRGVEVAIDVFPVDHPDFTWRLGTSFFANRSKITSLPIPAFETGGFGTSLGAFRIEEGKSATQIVGNTSPTTVGIVGDAAPDFQMSFSNDIRWKRFTIGTLLDWKQGGDVINLTQFLYDIQHNAGDVPDGGAARRADFQAGHTKAYVQEASYVKLREVSLTYDVPVTAVAFLFGSSIRNARVSFSARNLLRFTGYEGLDPEVSNFGNQAIARNIDVAPFPPSRSFFLSIDLGF
ncbi:MAG TPA: SusC/RagA family TonB-linked outer membrane protein [Gemmatimonadales bacterium]|jgi:TonB-linked SusC/RagA family outer membrane protein|nr:SusC/RagA family TonB-linked outer membrane protein [Gemmatimonadales bacterium]